MQERPSCTYCNISIPLSAAKFREVVGPDGKKRYYHADGGDRSCHSRALAVEDAKPFLLKLADFLIQNGVCDKQQVQHCVEAVRKTGNYNTLREIASKMIQVLREKAEEWLKRTTKDVIDSVKAWLNRIGELLKLPKGDSVFAT